MRIVKWEPEHRTIYVKAAAPGRILIRTFYYPRWKAKINGNVLSISPDPLTGLIETEIPQGNHDVDLKFEASVYRSVGTIIAFLAAGTVFAFLFREN